jgi:hypothetical protein
MEKAARFHCRHIGGNGRGGFGKGDGELGQAVGDGICHRARKHRGRARVKPARRLPG